jgi:hypothetical protein
MTIPTHKLYKSTRIKGRFALDNPDGPTLSSWHPIVLVLGPFALAGHVETDSDTSWFVVSGGNFRDDAIELREGLTVREH